QAALIAGVGTLLAATIYLAAAGFLNEAFTAGLPAGADVARLPPAIMVSALALSLLASLIAAAISGYSLSRLQPMEALRER
ncbi:MAG: ABC transporter permease, partial [Pseudomonadota bacterium]